MQYIYNLNFFFHLMIVRLLSNGPSLLQSRELDLVRDGSVFVMTQVAIVLADSSNVTNLPEVKIKIDDIHQRQIRSFSRVLLK